MICSPAYQIWWQTWSSIEHLSWVPRPSPKACNFGYRHLHAKEGYNQARYLILDVLVEGFTQIQFEQGAREVRPCLEPHLVCCGCVLWFQIYVPSQPCHWSWWYSQLGRGRRLPLRISNPSCESCPSHWMCFVISLFPFHSFSIVSKIVSNYHISQKIRNSVLFTSLPVSWPVLLMLRSSLSYWSVILISSKPLSNLCFQSWSISKRNFQQARGSSALYRHWISRFQTSIVDEPLAVGQRGSMPLLSSYCNGYSEGSGDNDFKAIIG